MKARPWTTSEIAYVRENVGRFTHATLAAHLGRTTCAVKKLALRKRLFVRRRFTAADDAVIRSFYGKVPARQIAGQIGRAMGPVHRRACLLGLTGKRIHRGPEFDTFVRTHHAMGESDAQIAQQCGAEGSGDVAPEIQHPYSFQYLAHSGLPPGCVARRRRDSSMTFRRGRRLSRMNAVTVFERWA